MNALPSNALNVVRARAVIASVGAPLVVMVPLRDFQAHATRFVPLAAGERYTLESAAGAILLIVEGGHFEANERGISTPQRIGGQRWPGEQFVRAPKAPSAPPPQ